MKVIVYENGGVVNICRPSYNDSLMKKSGMTEQEILDFVVKKDVPKGCKYKVMEESSLPSLDRRKRDKWKFCDNQGIKLEVIAET